MPDANLEGDADVLIVGAGPIGMLLSILLVRAGVRIRLIDKAPAPDDKSKAMAILPRTMEIFASIGVSDEILRRGRHMKGINATPGKRRFFLNFEILDTPYSYFISLQQYQTEQILRQRVESLGVTIERPVALVGYEQHADRVVSELKHADGRIEKFSTGWVVGCDGAKSDVRRLAGIPYKGYHLDMRFVFADVHVDWPVRRDVSTPFFSPYGLLLAIPQPEEGYWRIVFNIPSTQSAKDVLTLEEFERQMLRRSGHKATLRDPKWLHSFEVNQMRARYYRNDRVLIAGDAGHCHSPVGAQGMNTGLQDAFNLGWKLALVARGESDASLLDTYSAERTPVAATILRFTDRLTKMVTMGGHFRSWGRKAFLNVAGRTGLPQRFGSWILSNINFRYPKSSIVCKNGPSLLGSLGAVLSGRPKALRSWWDFRRGKRPGMRGLCLEWQQLTGLQLTEFLAEAFAGTQHVVLLFEGLDGDASSNVADVVRPLQERYPAHIVACVVGTTPTTNTAENGVRRLVDSTGALHRRFGAQQSVAFVLRPDHYIAFRSQPPEANAIQQYFDSLLTAKTNNRTARSVEQAIAAK